MKWLFALIGCLMLGGVTTLILKEPSDSDHAAATPGAMLMALRDPSGAGPLDGLRFDTVHGTVMWSVSRWSWDTQQVLEFKGSFLDQPIEVLTNL